MTTVTTIPAIDRLESALLEHPSVDVGGVKTCQLLHHFGPGIYIRELRRPPDTFIIGHAHKTKHLNILVSGDLAVYMAGKVTRFRAGDVFLSEAGVRKLTYTVGGATLMTVHPTNETDLSKIEDELVEKSEAFLIADLAEAHIVMDRADYLVFVEEVGMTHEQIKSLMMVTDDLIDMPAEFDGAVTVRPSRIQGVGVFANLDFNSGSLICATRIGLQRTPAGRFTNHSIFPNGEMRWVKGGDIHFFALRDIRAGEEITADYRQSRIAAELALKEFVK